MRGRHITCRIQGSQSLPTYALRIGVTEKPVQRISIQEALKKIEGIEKDE
jgi:hypothetical protein